MNIPLEFLVLVAIVIGALGFFLGNLIRKIRARDRLASAEAEASRILKEAERDAEALRKDAALQAKEIVYQAKAESEKESQDKRQELLAWEKRLKTKEEHLEKREELIDQKEMHLEGREKKVARLESSLAEKEQRYKELLEEEKIRLENLAGISSQEAKKMLMAAMEDEARAEVARLVRTLEEEAREEAERKARDILAMTIQRYASDVVSEGTVSVVQLPNDEMKGRIIGREGRNIRAIEAATGVEVIIDDTPESVVISGFNPIKRQIAKIALERLVADGRIHPARIEEVVEKVTKEVESSIKEAGEQAAFEVGVHGLHPELIKLIGKLNYRTSYGQNCLLHSKEVAFMCGMMASELGMNVKLAKRAGLLHDIGKAVDHEVEGPHALIGADLARRFGEVPKIVHAIAAHHEDEKPQSILPILVNVADALSAARPGARREMYEAYIQRVRDLERIATSFKGVSKAYAVHAGREVRVIVEPSEISDADALFLARELAKKIESELTYPGQIKVTVIREARAMEYAR